MRYVPRSLLIHEAALYEEMGKDVFGGKVYGNEIKLKYIRVEYTSGINRDGIKGFNDKSASQAVMYYDCKNSMPDGMTFKSGQKIIWDGHEFTVNGCTVYYGSQKPHHAEVTLEEVGL